MKERADLAQALAAAIPQALRLLRERAGHTSLRPAAQAIKERTGHGIGRATLSEWERGTKPVIDSLIYFLVGLGYDFTHFQSAIDEVMRQEDDPATTLADRLRGDAELRDRLHGLLEKTSAESEPVAQFLDYLKALDDRGDDQDSE